MRTRREEGWTDRFIASTECVSPTSVCTFQVMWSGGIDSTVALVALVEAARKKDGRMEKLLVCLDKTSIDEYPKFYEESIKGQLKVVDLTGR